jgi:hypothetical protein
MNTQAYLFPQSEATLSANSFGKEKYERPW